MNTATIQIGNTDDKLSQAHWHLFVKAVNDAIVSLEGKGLTIHFHGCSPSDAPWQNACWVISPAVLTYIPLHKRLNEIRKDFRQESIAWTEGETSFLK